MRKIICYLAIFMILTFSVFAISDTSYSQPGANPGMTNQGAYDADYNTDDVDRLNIFITDRGNISDYAPVVIGNIDDDIFPEIVNGDQNGLQIIYYDGATVIEEYSDTSIEVYSPVTLFDGDGDNKLEMYFCGVGTDGNSSFYAYQVNESGLIEMWHTQVGDGIAQPDVSADKGCGFYRPFLPQTYDTIYSPVCKNVGGTKYCFYVASSMQPTFITRQSQYATIYRFNALTGERSFYDPLSGAGFSECLTAGFNIVVAFGTAIGMPTINDDEKVILTPVCDLDDDGNEEMIVTMSCFDNGGVDFDHGLLLVDLETMTKDTSLSSDGWISLKDVDGSYLTSPLCVNDGTEFVTLIGQEVDGFGSSFLKVDTPNEVDDLLTGLGLFFDLEADQMSNLFIGSYTGENREDVCAIVDNGGDNDINIGCARYTGLIGDTFETQLFPYTGSYDIKSFVLNDDSGASSDLAGDTDDDFMWHYGVYRGSFDDETPVLATFGFLDQTGNCIMADINLDGSADVVCTQPTNISFFITQSEENQQVDLINVTPDVGGHVMCRGNQSFLLGYNDAENNLVRGRVSCTNNGTWDNITDFVTHGTEIIVKCNYDVDGNYKAKICAQDFIHPNDFTQCEFIETQVSDISGCEEPDDVYDPEDAIIDQQGVEDDETEDDLEVSLLDNIILIINSFGGKSQGGREFLILLILGIIVAGISGSAKSIGGIVIGALIFITGLAFSTLELGMRPIYLFVVVLMIIFILFVIWIMRR